MILVYVLYTAAILMLVAACAHLNSEAQKQLTLIDGLTLIVKAQSRSNIGMNERLELSRNAWSKFGPFADRITSICTGFAQDSKQLRAEIMDLRASFNIIDISTAAARALATSADIKDRNKRARLKASAKSKKKKGRKR